MINENEPCLKLRNRTTRDQETYCKRYTKKARGYFRHLFLQIKSVGLFVMSLLGIVFSVLIASDNDPLANWIVRGLTAVFLLFWIYEIVKGIWFWKYAKHVVVTNEGIWIMYYSTFWWSEDFRGKKRFLSPCWSLYGWYETTVTSNEKVRPKSPVKLADFFDDYDYAVVKSSKLSTLFLKRFDGVEQVDFLSPSDSAEILEYAKKVRSRKKKSKISADEEESSENEN